MNIYPQVVVEAAELALEAFKEFAEEEDVNKEILYRLLADSLLEKFIQGTELIWKEGEILDIMKMSIAESVLETLKSAGYIDSIQDESGEEWVWRTEKGNQYLKELGEGDSFE